MTKCWSWPPKCGFLLGKKGFKVLTFDWIFEGDNALKVIEGNYIDEKIVSPKTQNANELTPTQIYLLSQKAGSG